MLDDLPSSGLGTLFRLLKSIVVDVLYDTVCYPVGWLTIKLLTFGKYPETGLKEAMKDDSREESWVAVVGVVPIALLGYLLFA